MKNRWIFLFLIPFIFIFLVVFNESLHYPMWMDEYVFYRLSLELPKYSSTADWFYNDRPEVMNWSVNWAAMGFDYDKALRQVYDVSVYPHSPLAPILVSPIVKGLNYLADKGVISHIEDQPGLHIVVNTGNEKEYEQAIEENVMAQRTETMTIILRMIPMALLGLSLWLIFKLMYAKVGINSILILVPAAAFRSALSGAYLFYWDAFMMFFFVLTFYLMETRPNSKWQYLTACCMINTKMFIPFIFLIPLVVKGFMQDKKKGLLMLSAGFSILPWYFVTAYVNHDLFYPFTHYLAGLWVHNYMYTLVQTKAIFNFSTIAYVVVTIPILYYFKKYPVYAILWLVSMLYAWGTGLGVTHMSCLLYVGALVIPLVAYELHIMGRETETIPIKRPIG